MWKVPPDEGGFSEESRKAMEIVSEVQPTLDDVKALVNIGAASESDFVRQGSIFVKKYSFVLLFNLYNSTGIFFPFSIFLSA
jgi:hypothetical protein